MSITDTTIDDLKVKYRPRRFDEVIGQERSCDALRKQVCAGKPSSGAALFTGTRGTGKTTNARILSAGLNCPDVTEEGEPCGECRSCRTILSGDASSLAVQEYDCASIGGVDNARNLVNSLRMNPAADVRWRVIIFDEAHKLSTSAMAALLKPIEEPIPGTFFAFCTTEADRLDKALVSRMQVFRMQNVNRVDLAAQITKIAAAEDIELADDDVERIVGSAGGSVRAAIGNLMNFRDGLTLIDANVGVDVIAALIDGNVGAALAAVKMSEGEGTLDPAEVCTEVQRFYGDVLAVRYKPELLDVLTRTQTGGFTRLVSEAAENEEISQSELIRGTSVTSRALTAMNSSGSTIAQLEAAIVQILSPEEENVARRVVELLEETAENSGGSVIINVNNYGVGRLSSGSAAPTKSIDAEAIAEEDAETPEQIEDDQADDLYDKEDPWAGNPSGDDDARDDNWPPEPDADDIDGEDSAEGDSADEEPEVEANLDDFDDSDDGGDADGEQEADAEENWDDDPDDDGDEPSEGDADGTGDDHLDGSDDPDEVGDPEGVDEEEREVSEAILRYAGQVNSKRIVPYFKDAEMFFDDSAVDEDGKPLTVWVVELASPVSNKKMLAKMREVCRKALSECDFSKSVEIDIYFVSLDDVDDPAED